MAGGTDGGGGGLSVVEVVLSKTLCGLVVVVVRRAGGPMSVGLAAGLADVARLVVGSWAVAWVLGSLLGTGVAVADLVVVGFVPIGLGLDDAVVDARAGIGVGVAGLVVLGLAADFLAAGLLEVVLGGTVVVVAGGAVVVAVVAGAVVPVACVLLGVVLPQAERKVAMMPTNNADAKYARGDSERLGTIC